MHGPIPELDRKGLREFGLTTGGIVAGLFGLLLPWLLARPWPLWPWMVASVLVVWALLAPDSLRRVYRGWMRLGLLLGAVTTPIILGLVYFLAIVPAGLLMRWLGNDPMARRRDPAAPSYRVESEAIPRDRMERPF
jgi:hypothetical protein